ncbi:MAG: 4Fe-4S dicluster domain-containing protein [Candidatus Omnitrophota bacterium]
MAGIKINKDRCKGCQLCLIFCPKGFITLEAKLNKKGLKTAKFKEGSECSACCMCAMICPECCIEVWK